MNKKAFALGLLSSLFFATTFILNRNMQVEGGNFLWTASLRFLFMFPLLFALVCFQGGLSKVSCELKRKPVPWLLWSFVGFGIFYFFLAWGSDYGSSWLVVGTWQLTIVMGVLLTPLFHSFIPRRNLIIALVIVFGVFLIEYENATQIDLYDTVMVVVTVLIAAIAYPLGNRKLMALDHDLTTIERVFAMTLCSLPFWLVLSAIAYFQTGFPSVGQTLQGGVVGVFSGVLATVMFFHATDMSKFNQKALAITESTIAGEVVFTLLGGVLLLGDPIPSALGWIGLTIITLGLAFNR